MVDSLGRSLEGMIITAEIKPLSSIVRIYRWPSSLISSPSTRPRASRPVVEFDCSLRLARLESRHCPSQLHSRLVCSAAKSFSAQQELRRCSSAGFVVPARCLEVDRCFPSVRWRQRHPTQESPSRNGGLAMNRPTRRAERRFAHLTVGLSKSETLQ